MAFASSARADASPGNSVTFRFSSPSPVVPSNAGGIQRSFSQVMGLGLCAGYLARLLTSRIMFGFALHIILAARGRARSHSSRHENLTSGIALGCSQRDCAQSASELRVHARRA